MNDTFTLDNACNITTGKLDANAYVKGGVYPFFTCASEPTTIDSYSYNADVILIAGNNAQGNFHLNRFLGKFNAYQRTYILTIKDEYDLDYIFYALKLELKRLKEYAQGSQTKFLTMPILTNLNFLKRTLTEQNKIAFILSSLDKKIQLNNQTNQKLEAMAKTLYDYWFVQFDFPFDFAQGKPDTEGKPYKSSGGKMVYNEELKREIPEGWEAKELSDIANITMGQSPSGDSYNENENGSIFFQGSTDFGWRFPTVRQFTIKPNRVAKKGDILLSVRAPVGTLNIADNECCIGRGLASLNSKDGFTSYLYYVMVNFKKIFDHRNTAGTTFGSITKDDLYSLELIYPSRNLLRKYDVMVSKYNEKILSNHKENQKLTQLRDWLLPMLMNGQVGVEG